MLTVVLGVTAGLIQLAGYWLYNKGLRKTEINPNATSWAIWGIGSVVAVIVYSDLVNDWVLEFLPTVCAVAALLTFIHMMVRGTFKRPDRTEALIFVLDMAVLLYYFTSDNALIANIFMVIDILISFVPIIRSTWDDPIAEDPKPWLIWSGAYTLLVLVSFLRGESLWDALMPTAYLFLHIIIWRLAKRQIAMG